MTAYMFKIIVFVGNKGAGMDISAKQGISGPKKTDSLSSASV